MIFSPKNSEGGKEGRRRWEMGEKYGNEGEKLV
jgi:hypothetical protein